jgi:hypothetical protein
MALDRLLVAARLAPARPLWARALFAAYAHDIAGLSSRWAIGYGVGLKGTGHRYDHTDPLPRFKTAPKIVASGRQTAHVLGAWPWAQYRDGELPDPGGATTLP